MGVSTDAILAYGFDIGAREDFPDALLAVGKEEDDDYFHPDRVVPGGEPFELIAHCSGDYQMYFLAARGTKQRAWRGQPQRAVFDTPDNPAAIAAMKAFCEQWGFEWHEPAWHIFSNWN